MSLWDMQVRGSVGEISIYSAKELSKLGPKAIEKILSRGFDSVIDVLVESAHEVRNEMAILMRNSPPTGRVYTGGGRTAPHIASSPDNPPRIDFGDLVRSLQVEERIHGGFGSEMIADITVGSRLHDPDYPLFLEKGTAKMKKRPFVQPAMEKKGPEVYDRVMNAIRKAVENPGI